MALREALLNALYRGNLEISFDELQDLRKNDDCGDQTIVEQRTREAPYGDRKIHVSARVSREEARFVVQDAGLGFDHQSTVNSAALGPLGANGKQQGRGIVLMQTFMDDLSYNESGNEVTLVKCRDAT